MSALAPPSLSTSLSPSAPGAKDHIASSSPPLPTGTHLQQGDEFRFPPSELLDGTKYQRCPVSELVSDSQGPWSPQQITKTLHSSVSFIGNSNRRTRREHAKKAQQETRQHQAEQKARDLQRKRSEQRHLLKGQPFEYRHEPTNRQHQSGGPVLATEFPARLVGAARSEQAALLRARECNKTAQDMIYECQAEQLRLETLRHRHRENLQNVIEIDARLAETRCAYDHYLKLRLEQEGFEPAAVRTETLESIEAQRGRHQSSSTEITTSQDRVSSAPELLLTQHMSAHHAASMLEACEVLQTPQEHCNQTRSKKYDHKIFETEVKCQLKEPSKPIDDLAQDLQLTKISVTSYGIAQRAEHCSEVGKKTLLNRRKKAKKRQRAKQSNSADAETKVARGSNLHRDPEPDDTVNLPDRQDKAESLSLGGSPCASSPKALEAPQRDTQPHDSPLIFRNLETKASSHNSDDCGFEAPAKKNGAGAIPQFQCEPRDQGEVDVAPSSTPPRDSHSRKLFLGREASLTHFGSLDSGTMPPKQLLGPMSPEGQARLPSPLALGPSLQLDDEGDERLVTPLVCDQNNLKHSDHCESSESVLCGVRGTSQSSLDSWHCRAFLPECDDTMIAQSGHSTSDELRVDLSRDDHDRYDRQSFLNAEAEGFYLPSSLSEEDSNFILQYLEHNRPLLSSHFHRCTRSGKPVCLLYLPGGLVVRPLSVNGGAEVVELLASDHPYYIPLDTVQYGVEWCEVEAEPETYTDDGYNPSVDSASEDDSSKVETAQTPGTRRIDVTPTEAPSDPSQYHHAPYAKVVQWQDSGEGTCVSRQVLPLKQTDRDSEAPTKHLEQATSILGPETRHRSHASLVAVNQGGLTETASRTLGQSQMSSRPTAHAVPSECTMLHANGHVEQHQEIFESTDEFEQEMALQKKSDRNALIIIGRPGAQKWTRRSSCPARIKIPSNKPRKLNMPCRVQKGNDEAALARTVIEVDETAPLSLYAGAEHGKLNRTQVARSLRSRQVGVRLPSRVASVTTRKNVACFPSLSSNWTPSGSDAARNTMCSETWQKLGMRLAQSNPTKLLSQDGTPVLKLSTTKETTLVSPTCDWA